MGVLHGERVDKSVTAISPAAVTGRKFYLLKSGAGPKNAVLPVNNGAASGVSRTQTDGADEEFQLVTEGTVLVDANTTALAIDKEVQADASGDAQLYAVALGKRALGVTRSDHPGGAGLQVMVELYPVSIQPDQVNP